MSYSNLTTVENIQAYFQNLVFTSSSRPTDTQVDNWIAQATATIYGALADMYAPEITNESDLLQLQSLADSFVLVNVRNASGLNPARQLADGSMITKDSNLNEFYRNLDMYKTGKIILPNSARAGTYLSSKSYNNANSLAPVFKKNEVQW